MHLFGILSTAIIALASASAQGSAHAQADRAHAPALPQPSTFITSIKKPATHHNRSTFAGAPMTTALAKRQNNAYTVTEYHCGLTAVIIGDAGLYQYYTAMGVTYDARAHAYVAPPCTD